MKWSLVLIGKLKLQVSNTNTGLVWMKDEVITTQ